MIISGEWYWTGGKCHFLFRRRLLSKFLCSIMTMWLMFNYLKTLPLFGIIYFTYEKRNWIHTHARSRCDASHENNLLWILIEQRAHGDSQTESRVELLPTSRRPTFPQFLLIQTLRSEIVWDQEGFEPSGRAWPVTGEHCVLLKQRDLASVEGDARTQSCSQPLCSVCSTILELLRQYNFHGCILLQSPENSNVLVIEKRTCYFCAVLVCWGKTWWD